MQRLMVPITSAVLLVSGIVFGAQRLGQTAEQFDILIRNGQVFDGTGNPWFHADIGIRDGRIVAVKRMPSATAKRIIDARGRSVMPGFIDLHSAADDERGNKRTTRDPNPHRRAAANLVTQGITTIAVNQDGLTTWPVLEQRTELEKLGTGPNTMLFVGHGTIRMLAMGDDYRRPATGAEIDRIKALIRQGMDEGSWGMSSGREYFHGRWSDLDEMITLVKEIEPYGGVFIEHMRSEAIAPMWWTPSKDAPGAPSLVTAVKELIEIGERSGVTVVATHLKARGVSSWGASHTVVQLIERARNRGVEVWGSQYPYNTSAADGQSQLMPDWSLGLPDKWDLGPAWRPNPNEDYAAALGRTLANPEAARRLRIDLAHQLDLRGGPENIVILDYPEKSYIGKSLAEVAKARGKAPLEMVLTLQLEGFKGQPGGVRLRCFSGSEEDMETFMAQPWVATGTDTGAALPEDGPGVHARAYGSYPRKFRHYVMERKVMSVGDAVRSSTSLPGQILGLRDRGQIREGFNADIIIADLDRLRDRATFADPHQYSEGIDYVLVNGTFVVEDGRPTWALPGKVLLPPWANRTSRANQSKE